jgi:hypothetical protein
MVASKARFAGNGTRKELEAEATADGEVIITDKQIL